MTTVRGIAIMGGGPAGAALATHLRRSNHSVVLFEPQRRPPLIVGESLVPALIPLLKDLGIEDEVAAVSTLKPGATFYSHPDQSVSFIFSRAGRGSPNYAYNTPRNSFDEIVLRNAERCGVPISKGRAGIELDPSSGEPRLAPGTLASWRSLTGSDAPDLIVDASGRSRTLAKLLGLPSWEGSRKDAALFAHLSSTDLPHEGHIHINRLSRGWSWRIPLLGKVSVGVVIPASALEAYGDTAEEQYDALCRTDPTLASFVQDAERLTPVMKYSNYQLASQRWVGSSWALLGDAGGFIDPIFSSGLLLALEGAAELAHAINNGWDRNAQRYEKTMARKLAAWRSLIESFYDGRMFSLFRLKRIYADSKLFRYPSDLVDRQLALALSGVAPASTRRLWLLSFLLRYLNGSSKRYRLKIA